VAWGLKKRSNHPKLGRKVECAGLLSGIPDEEMEEIFGN
jgi:uncharacterized protein (DUF1810 family)